jgi:sugar lactone lactonase YvrE
MGWGANGGTQPYFSDPVGIKDSPGQPALSSPAYGVFADPVTNLLYIGATNAATVYVYNIANGEISQFAGNGVAGFAGDGSAAASSSTELNYPIGSARDSEGNIYIADNNNCAIRKVTTNGDITTIAGGKSGSLNGCGYSGDGGPAVDAQFSANNGVALDSSNNIYIADYNNCAIRKITASTGDVSTIAGVKALGCGYSGDGGPANQAQIRNPQQVAVDGAGNVYFADEYNQQIREIVARTGYIETVAGDQSAGYSGDGIAINNAISYPQGVAVDTNGNIFFSDSNNQILRWVTPSGYMITFAGTVPGSPISSSGYSGDGGKALAAQLNDPFEITRDSSGNTYVADTNNGRVRSISAFPGYGLSTASLTFDTQPLGATSDFQAVTVSAIGPTTISGITASTGFSEIDDCVGEALVANQTCEIDVYFSPTVAGKDYGSITLSSNAFFADNPHIISVSGVGGGLKLAGSLVFGYEPLKTPAANTLTLTASGTAVTLSKIYLTVTTAFSITGGTCPVGGGALAANASCTIIVSFDPTAVGFDKSTLVVTSNDPASPLLAEATGTGTEVKTSLSSIAFGSISYGTTSTINLTITNTGAASFTLTPAISGAGFSISSTGKTCTTSLAAGANCVLPIEYDPSAVGMNSGTLTLTTNGGSSPVLPLSGTATTDVSETPTSLAFGTITHGTTKTLNVTVTNVGKIASLSVGTSLTGTGAADFAVLTTGNTCTAGVAPGKSCTLPVEFKPAAADAYSATLTITTNGGANPTVALTGTGD